MVWKILLGVASLALLCVLTFVFASLKIRIFYDNGGKPNIKIYLLCFRFTLKEKKKDEKEKKENSEEKNVPFLEKLKSTVNTIKMVVKEIIKFYPKIKIEKLKIDVTVCAKDAALTAIEYGTASAIIYPLVGFLSSSATFKDGAEDVNIFCDYNKDKPSIFFDIILSAKLRHIISALLNFVLKEKTK